MLVSVFDNYIPLPHDSSDRCRYVEKGRGGLSDRASKRGGWQRSGYSGRGRLSMDCAKTSRRRPEVYHNGWCDLFVEDRWPRHLHKSGWVGNVNDRAVPQVTKRGTENVGLL